MGAGHKQPHEVALGGRWDGGTVEEDSKGPTGSADTLRECALSLQGIPAVAGIEYGSGRGDQEEVGIQEKVALYRPL